MGNSVKRALISVSDKTGVLELARELEQLGVEIISTGGTAKLLEESGVKVTGISEVTGFPEIMDGRVKTLHPNIHGGLLGVRDLSEHQQQMEENGIKPIDLVIVNLYPFAETIAKPDVTFKDAIENIDIGGPSMLRSAAKNHAYVTVLVDQQDYAQVLSQLKHTGEVEASTRQRLAAKVFRHTAAYDSMIGEYLTQQVLEQQDVTSQGMESSSEAQNLADSELVKEQYHTEKLTVTFEKVQDLRYGENPHQKAAFYRLPQAVPSTISQAEQLHGKELSYNNINDADAALSIVREFKQPAVVAVKHMNPCGVGIGATIEEAFDKAYEADPVSIFGGIVAANRVIDEQTALKLSDIFLEIVMAPDFTPEALSLLQKKKNIRLLKMGEISAFTEPFSRYQTVAGGLLVQDQDILEIEADQLQVVTERAPSNEELEQLLFAWKVVKHVKSNAIVLAKDGQTIGVGAGQMNRVGSAKIAIEQAGEKSKGSVLSSDAFFPMGDTVQTAAAAGVTAIIQPGGSIKDEESIQEANKHGIAMVFTGVRHFKH
ncbi:bifunctional phosphoribosylaminoimidazolecarboxamide formyltransferase/IMP cyclohydrolase [Bacillus horti]|uniref:Bifunctional purine biosynthesis protein PurH n=1 Tax=Caldalkalibacillus horti TaxID=77523 RepID=A0ABT9W1V5_9BACI|nr:bifunctional phosphoribosylaminoimidazolecarboxamide formyltransferase/IMP cyclohydrolase [Bacillus horti]MDQ0167221.1 phosphoribosylaminoimidazolecarboxamide formyltransferase/IMP cyclohydrolase [Bacillus horti]